MKIKQILAAAVIGILSAQAHAGTIFYVAIPATNSDTSAGISASNTYTSAVDGGNTTGADRVVNGVTLHALTGTGDSFTADGITLNALTGTLANGGGASASIQVDGVFGDVMKDMTFNDGVADGSQQEILLDPATLVAGKTYDLRVYVCNSSGQNRLVNIAFACDAQAAVETGFFNEDDAATSAGGFTDKNQVYYIDYRYTWDGATTPGLTITQKAGVTPFCLYALTNQEIAGAPAAVQPVGNAAPPAVASGPDVGVSSDEFENCDCLREHGRWIKLGRYGRCWQPHMRPDWRPYTCGHWVHADCGWTWVCDEEEDSWGWACYHYGRWCHDEGAGWCWVPGRVWGPAWVSWRESQGGDCSCVGWAPLPPEANCSVGVGISTWVDSSCGIGPGYYNFCNINNLSVNNVSTVIIAQQENVNIIQNTVNITNIVNNNTVIYNGGPNVAALNTRILQGGGKPVPTGIILNRKIGAGPLVAGGKFSQLQGNTLSLTGPKLTPLSKTASLPVAETIKTTKLDKGWNQVKDPKLASSLKTHIAQESKGKTPQNTRATLPAGVTLSSSALSAVQPTPTPGGKGKHPGQGQTLVGASPSPGVSIKGRHPGQSLLTGASPTPGAAGGQPTPTPGGKGKHPGQSVLTTGASPTPGVAGGQPTPTPGGKGKHPGQSLLTTGASPTPGVAGGQPTPTPGGKGKKHPGQSLTTTVASPTPGAAGGQPTPTPTPGGKGRHPGQAVTAGATVAPALTGGQPTPTPTPGGKGRKHPGQSATAVATVPPVVTGGQPTPTPTPSGKKGHTSRNTGGQPPATTSAVTGGQPTPAPTPNIKRHSQNISSQGTGNAGGPQPTPTPRVHVQHTPPPQIQIQHTPPPQIQRTPPPQVLRTPPPVIQKPQQLPPGTGRGGKPTPTPTPK